MDILTVYMTVDRFWDLLSKKTSGEANEAELIEFDDILLANPDWKNISETLALLWQQTHPFGNSEAEESFEKHVERMKKLCTGVTEFEQLNDSKWVQEDEKKYKPRTKKWWIPAAGIVTVTLGFFIFHNSFIGTEQPVSKPPSVNQVRTNAGSKTQIQLPDGSTVWLNASSQLTYDKSFGRNFREVQLTGEAFFDVVKDPAHPFIIHTKVIDVKVLGTQFNVRSYPDDANTETSLIRGRVEVTVKNRGEKYYLEPNEKVVVSNNIASIVPLKKNLLSKPLISIVPLTYYPVDSAIIETSWVDNRLIFQENETFRDVALKMERKYAVHIDFADEKVAEYHVFGSFTKETISEALTALKIGFRFNYKIDGENITISQ